MGRTHHLRLPHRVALTFEKRLPIPPLNLCFIREASLANLVSEKELFHGSKQNTD